MTTDLLLIPERLDFNNPLHVFGFDTLQEQKRTILELITLGLELWANSNSRAFAHAAVRIKVQYDRSPSIEDFQSTKVGHDLRCILGRNFLQ